MRDIRAIVERVASVSPEELEFIEIISAQPLSDTVRVALGLRLEEAEKIEWLSREGGEGGSEIFIPERKLYYFNPLGGLAARLGLEVGVEFVSVNGTPIYFVREPPVTPLTKKIYAYLRARLGETGIGEDEDIVEYVRGLFEEVGVNAKLAFTVPDVRAAVYYTWRDLLGYGPIELLMEDPEIEEISWFAHDGPVLVADRVVSSALPNADLIYTNIFIPESVDDGRRKFLLGQLVRSLASRARVGLTTSRPIAEGRIPDPSGVGFHRLSAHLDVVSRSHGFTIRKFPQVQYSLTRLISWNTLNSLLAAYLLYQLLQLGFVLIVGTMGSGKTTLLQAIISAVPPTYKVITIEDTPELRTPAQNWHPLYTRRAYSGTELENIDYSRLVQHAFRHRGKIVTLGEVRGPEMNDLIQAAASVSGDTPVLVRVDGEVKLMPIGQVVDELYGDEPDWTRVVPNRRLEVLTLSRDGRLMFKPVAWVLRHRASRIYRVRFVGGEVRATGSHSVFVLDPETLELHAKRVSELKPGDILVSFVSRDPRRARELLGADASLHKLDVAKLMELHWRLTIIRHSELDAASLAWLARLAGFHTRARRKQRRRSTRWFVDILSGSTPSNGAGRAVPFKALVRLARLAGYRPRGPDSKLWVLMRRRPKLTSVENARLVLEEILEHVGGLEGEARVLAERILALIEGDVELTTVTSVEEEEYDGYVYDFSVPESEAFFGGVTPVLLHNSGHGAICLRPHAVVPALVGSGRRAEHRLLTLEELHGLVARGVPVRVASVNPETRRVEWRRVTMSVAVRTREWVRITTSTGRTLEMTPDHRMPVVRGGWVEWVSASEVREGDRILVSSETPPPSDEVTSVSVDGVMVGLNIALARLYAAWLVGGKRVRRSEYRMPVELVGPRELALLAAFGKVRTDDRWVWLGKRAYRLIEAVSRLVEEKPLSASRLFARALAERLEELGGLVVAGSTKQAQGLHYLLRVGGYDSVVVERVVRLVGPTRGGVVEEEVVSVERYEAGEPGGDPAYDIEVEGNHTFLTDSGIVSGNCTFHSDDPFKVLARITSPPINAAPESLLLITSIVHVARTKEYSSGEPRPVRRVLRTFEIVDVRGRRVSHSVVFKWDPFTDRFNIPWDPYRPTVAVRGLLALWQASRTVRMMGAGTYGPDEAPRALADIYALALILEELTRREVFDIKELLTRLSGIYMRFDALSNRLWNTYLKPAFRAAQRKPSPNPPV